ncbi:MAG: aldo/keto reductase [Nitrososphaerota archaeon]
MEYATFGRAGMKASRIGVGTYYDPLFILSAALLRFRRGRREKVAAIRRALELGINLIDTAELYRTEDLVAEAIEGFRRDEVLICGKVWPSHLRYEAVLKACEASLRRLRTSYLDLYLVHWPNPRVPLSETMRALERLVDEGKVRAIGVSNFSAEQVRSAQEALSKHELTAVQVEYSLLERRAEQELLPLCRKENLALMAYRPLAHGLLSQPTGALGKALRAVAAKYKKTAAQVALNWLLSKDERIFPIPRASRPARVEENAGGAGWRLQPQDLEGLEGALARAQGA